MEIFGFIWKAEMFSLVRHVRRYKRDGEVNISHENTTMVVWIYDGF